MMFARRAWPWPWPWHTTPTNPYPTHTPTHTHTNHIYSPLLRTTTTIIIIMPAARRNNKKSCRANNANTAAIAAMNTNLLAVNGPATVPAAPPKAPPTAEEIQNIMLGQNPFKPKKDAKKCRLRRKKDSSDSTDTTDAAEGEGEAKAPEAEPAVDGAGVLEEEEEEGEELTTEVTAFDREENLPEEKEEATPSLWGKTKAAASSTLAVLARGIDAMRASFLAVGSFVGSFFTCGSTTR